MDLDRLSQRLGFKRDDLVDVLDIFIDVTLSDLDKMLEAAEKGAADQVAQCAHSIKGAASNFEFDDIFERAKAVEMDARAGSVEGSAEAAGFIRESLAAMRIAIRDYRQCDSKSKKITTK